MTDKVTKQQIFGCKGVGCSDPACPLHNGSGIEYRADMQDELERAKSEGGSNVKPDRASSESEEGFCNVGDNDSSSQHRDLLQLGVAAPGGPGVSVPRPRYGATQHGQFTQSGFVPSVAAPGGEPPKCQVNPSTNRCIMCGRNEYQRQLNSDICPFQPTPDPGGETCEHNVPLDMNMNCIHCECDGGLNSVQERDKRERGRKSSGDGRDPIAKSGSSPDSRSTTGSGQEDSVETSAPELVIEIARELYDRFMMGGWKPEDVHGWLTEKLAKLPVETSAPSAQTAQDLLSTIQSHYFRFKKTSPQDARNKSLAAIEAYTASQVSAALKQAHEDLKDDFRWLQEISDALDSDRTRPDDLESMLHEIFILKSKARRADRTMTHLDKAEADLANLRELLVEWQRFSADCVAADACGDDELRGLDRRTAAALSRNGISKSAETPEKG